MNANIFAQRFVYLCSYFLYSQIRGIPLLFLSNFQSLKVFLPRKSYDQELDFVSSKAIASFP